MTFTFRRAFLGWVVLTALAPAARAVMPPYTSYPGSGSSPCSQDGDKSQANSNQQVLQALMENQKLLQQLLQRLGQGTLQISSAPPSHQTSSSNNTH